MTHRFTLLPSLATLLTGFLVVAPAAAQDAQDVKGQVKEAAMAKAPLGLPLIFSVEGLTEENLEKVTRSLSSMTQTVYVCSGCEAVATAAGTCSACDVELTAKEMPVLSQAVPSVKTAMVELTPFAARTLSYSNLANALTKNSIAIDDAKFSIGGNARLVLRGGSLEDVKSIEKALEVDGFFHTAVASYDADSTDIHVNVHATGTAPMYDKVVALVAGLDSEATLVDVIWGPKLVPAKS